MITPKGDVIPSLLEVSRTLCLFICTAACVSQLGIQSLSKLAWLQQSATVSSLFTLDFACWSGPAVELNMPQLF
eukprot:s2373_g10.t1